MRADMNITCTAERSFTEAQLKELFTSVGWVSGNYPEKLLRALNSCETVFTAWDGERLVGLANALDDGELTAYIHYLLIHPDYQKSGIGHRLIDMMKEKYRDYLCLFLVAEHSGLADYYKRLGFSAQNESTVMAISKH